jgi:hypothetical protein
MGLPDILFYVFAFLTLACGVLVIANPFSRNPITSRAEMIYDKERLLALGGVHAGLQKWKYKAEEAAKQDAFPVGEG